MKLLYVESRNAWLSDTKNGKGVGVVFIDVTKAFDLLNHDISIQRLKFYVLNESAVSFFKSYLSNRKQSVSLNGGGGEEAEEENSNLHIIIDVIICYLKLYFRFWTEF